MLKKILYLLPLVALLFGCFKGKHEFHLTSSNIEEEMPVLGNFNFTFNKNIVSDDFLGVWDSTEYVAFTPKINGAYKWIDGYNLVFSPSEPLLPSTKYQVEISDKTLIHAEKKKGMKKEVLIFKTPDLKVQSSDAFWGESDLGDGVVAKLYLAFNYSVSTENIEKNITVTIDDKKIPAVLSKGANTRFLTFELKEIPFKDVDYTLNITINNSILNSTDSKEEIKLVKVLKSPFQIYINNISVEHNGMLGTLKVMTSQEIVEADLNKFIAITPIVNFKTQVNEKGIVITSEDFDVNTQYQITLKQGLKGKIGGKLEANYTESFTFGKVQPNLYFEDKNSFYLSAKGMKNIQARIVGIDEVKIKISKLYENNILASSRYGSYNNYYYSDYQYDDYEDDYYYYEPSAQLEDIVYEKTIKTKDLPSLGSTKLLKLDFLDNLKDFNGIYHVLIQSTDNYWMKDARLLAISDLGLIAKVGMSNVNIFVNSIKTTESLSGVKVKVIGNNNQLIGEAITNSDGVASIALKNKNVKGFSPAIITASASNDFNILNLNNTKVNTTRFDIGGYKNLPNGLQTFIYFERDIYRPGEKVNVAAIIRNQNWNSPGNLPVKIDLKLPNGSVFKSLKKTLNDDGSFEANYDLSASTMTGWYSINIFSSNDVLLGSSSFLVEEFMPDRIKVSATLQKEKMESSEKNELRISAQNLFGTPASNRNYEVEISYQRKYFSPKNFANFSFDIINANNYFSKIYKNGTTDKDGAAIEEIVLDNNFKNIGVIQADIFTTVFDETGRPVNRKNELEIFTQKHLYGIGDFGYYLNTNTPISIPIVAVNKNGEAVSNTKALVQIIKHDYKSVLNKSGGYFRYESQNVETVIYDKVVTLNQVQNISFTPTLSGRYEVRVYNPEVNGKYVRKQFYCYGYGNTYLSSFDVNTEGNIDIEFDKETYQVGNTAKILFKTPFQGKMLITVEGKDLVEHFYVNTDKRSAELKLPIKENYLPNVYVTATLIKPHTSSEFPLTVANGFKSLSVEDSKRKMAVEIFAPTASRSLTSHKIKVKTQPNAKVTIAVVDEGILQVSGFKTPSPYSYFYQKRALQVNSHNVYPYLFPELSSSMSTAGDGGFDNGKRLNPIQNNRVKLVSYWSGILQTNSNGEASIDIDIPQFSGSLRVMAVAHKDQAFGSAEKFITVADPIIISSGIPRFLSPGDTAIISTTLTNTTDKTAKAKVTISATGTLAVAGGNKGELTIDKNGEQRILFKVYAKNQLGEGKITITADALGESFKEITDLPVRPASPLVNVSGSGSINGGKTKSIEIGQKNFMEGTTSYKLLVSTNPMIEFAKDLDYLVKYPYGCTEQTISAVFPQLYFNDISNVLYQDNSKIKDVNNNIAAAINILKMRQLYNGGFTMWQNGEESWWATAYALHFLVEAEKAGYLVDKSLMKSASDYLNFKLKTKETHNYYLTNNVVKKIAPKEVVYSLYALAIYGNPNASLMNYYKSNSELLSLDSKYLLAAAFAISGDKNKATEMLPSEFKGEISETSFGGSFYSHARDEAIALNALIEVNPNHPQIATMVLSVSQNLKNNQYLNTQERIFSLLALGKIARNASKSDITAIVKADGKTLGNYTKGSLTFSNKDIANKKIEILTTGNGKLYYFWEGEGIAEDGKVEEVDNYIKVRRTYYDRYGNQIKNNKFNQNDLIIVKLSIEKSYSSKIENVVISDILPSGFEVENQRYTNVPGTQWIKDSNTPTFIDIRDDRINFFFDIFASQGKTQNYYYVVRAVSPGNFKLGPVGAEAMYNGAFHSYSGSGRVYIE